MAGDPFHVVAQSGDVAVAVAEVDEQVHDAGHSVAVLRVEGARRRRAQVTRHRLRDAHDAQALAELAGTSCGSELWRDDREGLGRLPDHHRRADAEVVLVARVLVDHHLVGAARIGHASLDERGSHHHRVAAPRRGNDHASLLTQRAGLHHGYPEADEERIGVCDLGERGHRSAFVLVERRVVGQHRRVGSVGCRREGGHRVGGAAGAGHTGRHQPERGAPEQAEEQPRSEACAQVGARPHPLSGHRDHLLRSRREQTTPGRGHERVCTPPRSNASRCSDCAGPARRELLHRSDAPTARGVRRAPGARCRGGGLQQRRGTIRRRRTPDQRVRGSAP